MSIQASGLLLRLRRGAILSFVILPSLFAQPGTQINLSNGLVALSLNPATGSIESIVDVGTGVSFISVPPGVYDPLWELDLDSASSGPRIYANSDASQPTVSISTDTTGTVADLVWHGMGFANGVSAPAAVTTVEIQLPNGSRTASFTFKTENLSGAKIKHLRFPGIAGISVGGSGADTRLLVPEFGGRIFSDPVHQATGAGIGGFGLEYPGILSMQMMAFYGPQAGLFVASHDIYGQTKYFQWNTDPTTPQTGRIEMDHVFPSQPWETLTLPYECVVGTFHGDWSAAADLYKSWASDTPWVNAASTRKTPSWLDHLEFSRQFCMKDCGDPAWDTNYQTVLEEQSLNVPTFGSSALVDFSGWEHHPSWYYGDYFPPQDGWTAFDQFVTSLHSKFNYLQVAAPSPLFLDTAAPLWTTPSAQSAASLDENENVETETSVQGDNETHIWAFMNPAASFWQQNLIDTISLLAAHKVDVAQLDGWPISGMLDDYSAGHPAGQGGTWQTAALLATLANMRAAIAGQDFQTALCSEEVSEVFIPYLDLYTNRDLMAEAEGIQWGGQYGGEPVPLFPYVYKPYVQAQTSYWPSASAGNATYDYLAYARALTWGQIPNFPAGISLADGSLQSGILSYFEAVGKTLNTYSRFLKRGEMLPPPQIISPTAVASLSVGWGSPWSGTVDAIQSSAWRSVSNEIAIILTNISDATVSFGLPVDFDRWGLKTGLSYSVEADGESGTGFNESVTDTIDIPVTIKPRQIMVFRIQPPRGMSCQKRAIFENQESDLPTGGGSCNRAIIAE